MTSRPGATRDRLEVTPADAEALIRDGAALIDVREPDEWRTGHLPGATLLQPAQVAQRIASIVPEPSTPVVLYCAVGGRSLVAARQLAALGYATPLSLAGGIVRWQAEGRPVKLPAAQTNSAPATAASARYARQMALPEVGPAGQARLADARVLVVGAGGLGSPALLYLAAAGVGTVGVVDHDTVELSNLHRQVVHAHDRLGRHKTESAAEALRALNPEVNVVEHTALLTEYNVSGLISGYDVVIDGSDTFATRYALNDAAAAAGVSLVHASVYRFEGQLTVFAPPAGPCYRCLYPAPPADEAALACAVTGVLGVVPGVMGMLQATEALKLLLGVGEPLIGRLLTWDALAGTFDEIRLRRDPACPTCGHLAAPADSR